MGDDPLHVRSVEEMLLEMEAFHGIQWRQDDLVLLFCCVQLWILFADRQDDEGHQAENAIDEALVDIDILYLAEGNRDFMQIDDAFDE